MGNTNSTKTTTKTKTTTYNADKALENNNTIINAPPTYDDSIELDNENHKRLEDEFRKNIMANKEKKTYIEIIIDVNLGRLENIINPYDPYILNCAERAYNIIINEQNVDKYMYNDMFNIDSLCKKYINYLIDENEDNEKVTQHIIIPIYYPEIESLLPPRYYNIIRIWITIIVMNKLYMNEWKPNGELRKIFGNDCKPFNLRFVIINTYINNNNTEYEYVKKLYDELSGNIPYKNTCYKPRDIKQRADGLPEFTSVINSIVNFNDNNRVVFYVPMHQVENAVKTYKAKTEKYKYESTS